MLVGKTPAQVTIAPIKDYVLKPPAIPIGVAGTLLERRPDVASAERRVAAANEQIGIAKAAYFPQVTIGAAAGLQSTQASSWFEWPSRLWAVGPSVSQVIYDGGRRRATTEAALANYDAAVALYRQDSLTAFQEVEDNLIALSVLAKEVEQQSRATDAAEKTLNLFSRRYQDGVDTYLQVVTSETTALQNERNDIELRRREMDASVLLVKAVGGGLLMVYTVQVLLYRDWLQPITRMAALPLAIGGAFLLLFATHTELGLPAVIGILMLMGIVDKNSILLVDYILEQMRHDVPRREAILAACQIRARPIVMTSLAMLAGMLPTALDIGLDPAFRAPMAVAVIGGKAGAIARPQHLFARIGD